MKVIIVGCGKIGSTLTARMAKEEHDVIVIDNDPAVLKDITERYDVIGFCGNATSYDSLTEAGVAGCDLFIAVTGSDEFNMLSCFVARKIGAKHTVARVRNSEYNNDSFHYMMEQLELSMSVNPELMMAETIFNILKLPSVAKVDTFSDRRQEMVEVVIKRGSPLDGMTLSGIRKKYPGKYLVTIIRHGDEVHIPSGNSVLYSGDHIALISAATDTHRILKMLGLVKKQVRDVLILGASTTSYYLAKLLLGAGNSVKIIEKNPERCEEVCEQLSGATVIRGDCMHQDLLAEEGLDKMDAVVALTGRDEENILISFYAMSQGVGKVVSKVNRDELWALSEKLGLDSILSPKMIISDVLARYARALENSEGSKVETLYSLMNGTAEALEFNVLPDFPFADTPLRDLTLVGGTLLAGITRGSASIIPGGDDVIRPGDRVVVVAAGVPVYDLEDIFRRK